MSCTDRNDWSMRSSVPCRQRPLLGSGLIDLLAKPEHNELGRLERREPDQDVDHPVVDVLLGGGGAVTFDEERLVRRAALECAGPELGQHERANVEAQLGPERL